MRRMAVFMLMAMVLMGCATAQNVASPQSARQALLEMFFSKTPGTFVKHLPIATRNALEKSGAMANLQQYSLMASQLQTQGNNLQTFESGSILLSSEDAKTGQKIEVTVENDALRGDQDDIALSFVLYKDGKSERTPFMPQMIFSMKKETQIWKLNEISFTVHLPLADPDLLKAITEKMTPQATVNSTSMPHGQISIQTASSDAMVIGAMRTILTAQVTYATTYPNVGYTCTLSDLDGFGGGEPNAHQAMLINSGLASGKRYGFVFSLAGCTGTPARTFQLTATPNTNLSGRKAFCADQSAVVRSSDDGNQTACLASGTPVP